MGRKRGSFRRCSGTRDNNTQCNNKALRHSHFCCKHDETRVAPRKAPEKRTLLFHLFFVYGYLRYGNVDFLKAEVSGARGAWHHIAHHVFDGVVTNATVQAHANRYKVWMEHNGMRSLSDVAHAMRDARAPSHRGKTCVSIPRLHTFLRFNEYTVPDLFRYQALIMINGVPYRLQEDGPVRVDEAFVASGMRNDFCTLQALDGYTLSVGMSAWRSSDTCPQLQEECLTRLCVDEANGNSMTPSHQCVPDHITLSATCVDALDDSGTAWQGKCPRVIDCSHLALAVTTVPEPPELPEAAAEEDPADEYSDMPKLEFTSLLEQWDTYGAVEYSFPCGSSAPPTDSPTPDPPLSAPPLSAPPISKGDLRRSRFCVRLRRLRFNFRLSRATQ